MTDQLVKVANERGKIGLLYHCGRLQNIKPGSLTLMHFRSALVLFLDLKQKY